MATPGPARQALLRRWTEAELEQRGQAGAADLFRFAGMRPAQVTPRALFQEPRWQRPFATKLIPLLPRLEEGLDEGLALEPDAATGAGALRTAPVRPHATRAHGGAPQPSPDQRGDRQRQDPLLAQLFLELYRQGKAVTLLDPHGDASRLILRQLVAQGPDRQDATMDRLVYLDLPGAAAAGHYLPFNVLRQPHLDPHTSARSVLEALRRAWPSLDEGQAPAFENMILASVFVLIVNRLPLTRLQDVLLDAGWREQLLARVEDETVLGFFRGRLARWGRERALLVESSLRRIFLLAFAPVLRHSLGQEENLLDLRQLIDHGRSLIVNLALPDPDARRLLGCLLTVGFEQAALSRASQPTAERGPDHVLLLDEFAEFASQSAHLAGADAGPVPQVRPVAGAGPSRPGARPRRRCREHCRTRG